MNATPAEPEETVSEAFDFVGGIAASYEKQMRDENGLDIRIDTDALQNLASSYIDDVRRYKVYHDTEIPDRARRAAYLCKWLMKFRPIVVLNPEGRGDEEVRTFSLMANELFAMLCVSGILGVDWTDEISDRMCVIFLYTLRHRFNSEDTYILFFAQLCNL